MEVFDNKKTEWAGLWYQPGGNTYISSPFNMAKLKQFKGKVRFIMRKNPGYEKGTNRPNYQIMVCDSKSDKEQDFKIMQAVSEMYSEGKYITVNTAAEIANRLLRDMEYGYSYDDLSVESYRFMEENAVTPKDMLEQWLAEKD